MGKQTRAISVIVTVCTFIRYGRYIDNILELQAQQKKRRLHRETSGSIAPTRHKVGPASSRYGLPFGLFLPKLRVCKALPTSSGVTSARIYYRQKLVCVVVYYDGIFKSIAFAPGHGMARGSFKYSEIDIVRMIGNLVAVVQCQPLVN